jgi:hypothetical protein
MSVFFANGYAFASARAGAANHNISAVVRTDIAAQKRRPKERVLFTACRSSRNVGFCRNFVHRG